MMISKIPGSIFWFHAGFGSIVIDFQNCICMYRLTPPPWPKVAIWWQKAKPRCLVLAKQFNMMFLQWVLGCFRIWTPIPSEPAEFYVPKKKDFIINMWIKQFRNTVIYRKHGLFSSTPSALLSHTADLHSSGYGASEWLFTARDLNSSLWF